MTLSHSLRQDYSPPAGLGVEDLLADPLQLFNRWLEKAIDSGLPEPNAMTLATVDGAGQPSARVVLLKEISHEGLSFFSNYQSRKGRELAANPRAALVFWWQPLVRQVRFEGRAKPIAGAESDAYFASRPRGSQLGAAASPQSAVIADRAELDGYIASLEARYDDRPIARPAHWGGYRLVPHAVEFWQGRPDRLHDRFRYERVASGEEGEGSRPDAGTWLVRRLAP